LFVVALNIFNVPYNRMKFIKCCLGYTRCDFTVHIIIAITTNWVQEKNNYFRVYLLIFLNLILYSKTPKDSTKEK